MVDFHHCKLKWLLRNNRVRYQNKIEPPFRRQATARLNSTLVNHRHHFLVAVVHQRALCISATRVAQRKVVGATQRAGEQQRHQVAYERRPPSAPGGR
jgi:hypothetical protein